MDILIYVLLAVVLALGAALVVVLLRRSNTQAQTALTDTVQRIKLPGHPASLRAGPQ